MSYIKIDGMNSTSYLHEDVYKEHMNDFIYINKQITNRLKDYPNFNGIDFCDVHAGGIQIRGRHKKFPTHTFGDQITIQYDFSNIEQAINDFAEMWKYFDEPDYIKEYKQFLTDGEKYGWN